MFTQTFWLIGAAVLTVVAFLVVALLSSDRKDSSIGGAITTAIVTAIFTYTVPQLLVYMFMPAMTGGVFGGWGEIAFCYILSLIVPAGVAAASMDDRDNVTDDLFMGAGIAVVFTLVCVIALGAIEGVGSWVNNTGQTQATAKLNYANISVAKNYGEMPQSDPTHIVMVTKAIASYEGQQAISSTGQNLGSIFHVESGEYTLQSVNVSGQPNLYWIAPLSYNTQSNQANYQDAPGYVMVDAENPNAPATLVQQDKLGHAVKIHYTITGTMGRNLFNHVYYAGYEKCQLDDPTLEIDDNLTPWYTISCVTPIPGNNFYLAEEKSVLVVDPNTGAITRYSLGHQPAWIDRVVSMTVANLLTDDWTRYKYAPYYQWNTNAGELKTTGDPEILYNYTVDPKTHKVSDKPDFMYQVTSNSDTDTTSTGFLSYSTQDTHGTYYPLGGITVGGTVNNTFQNAPQNIRNYSVGSVQFYNLYGVPTWVAVYQQSNDFGATFQAIGIVSAQNLNGANVIMAGNLNDALTQYQTWLATDGTSNKQNGTSAATGSSVTGTVVRISETTVNNKQTYFLIVSGSSHVFTIDPTLAGFQPNTQVGDTVRLGYTETGKTQAPVSSFDNLTIDKLLAPTATPTATPAK